MNYPKHVEFYSKNKFEKLVHLVGFVIRIKGIYYLFTKLTRTVCDDNRSTESKIHLLLQVLSNPLG